MKIIIDATEGTFGRIASYSAKQALLGKSIIILNCNDAIITGNHKSIVKEYQQSRRRVGSSLKGPKISRMPERILKRAIRGMLPHKQERGRTALKKIICYNKTPKEFENAEKMTFKRKLKFKPIKLSDLVKKL